MRFIREEISGADQTRYLFALNKEEALLIFQTLTQVYKVTPPPADRGYV